jgi:hypothetical protein
MTQAVATERAYPRWIGTGGFELGQRVVRRGYATYITAPGQIGRSASCDHNHRSSTAARACGTLMAERRNAGSG